jgi:hypothetical protein
MILSPDDHRSLQAIDGALATCEPHLAAMFRIFSRLNADEPPPPSEDLIVAVLPPASALAGTAPKRGIRGWRRSRAAQARLSARARAGSRPGGRAGDPRRAKDPRRAGDPSRAEDPSRAGGSRLARRGLWRPVLAISVPAVLLVTMLMVLFFTLTAGIKCRPAPGTDKTSAHSALVVAGGASLASCQQSTGTAKSAGTAGHGKQ